jgi:hypothetical protein
MEGPGGGEIQPLGGDPAREAIPDAEVVSMTSWAVDHCCPTGGVVCGARSLSTSCLACPPGSAKRCYANELGSSTSAVRDSGMLRMREVCMLRLYLRVQGAGGSAQSNGSVTGSSVQALATQSAACGLSTGKRVRRNIWTGGHTVRCGGRSVQDTAGCALWAGRSQCREKSLTGAR